jgi:ABC-type amino acid transport substrate-binding protein
MLVTFLSKCRFVAVVALFLLAAVLTAVAAGASTLAEVKSRGRLVMLSFPHQESAFIRVQVEVDLHHYEGIDYEILDGFARSLGVVLEVHPVKPSFADLVPALLRGEGDVIGSSFSITPERRTKVDFTVPYFAGRTVVVVPRESPIRTEKDLAGRTGATVRGSSLEERMKKFPGVRCHYVDFTRWNYDALMEKTADFSLLDETSTWGVLPSYPDLKVAFVLPGEDLYGFAVTPKSDLRAALDSYLETIQKNGHLDRIVKHYLGDTAESGVTRRGGAVRQEAEDTQTRETRQEVGGRYVAEWRRERLMMQPVESPGK